MWDTSPKPTRKQWYKCVRKKEIVLVQNFTDFRLSCSRYLGKLETCLLIQCYIDLLWVWTVSCELDSWTHLPPDISCDKVISRVFCALVNNCYNKIRWSKISCSISMPYPIYFFFYCRCFCCKRSLKRGMMRLLGWSRNCSREASWTLRRLNYLLMRIPVMSECCQAMQRLRNISLALFFRYCFFLVCSLYVNLIFNLYLVKRFPNLVLPLAFEKNKRIFTQAGSDQERDFGCQESLGIRGMKLDWCCSCGFCSIICDVKESGFFFFN